MGDNIEMMLYSKKGDCCGCGACASVCPKSAINMQEDKEGFLYPTINPEKCIHCKSCIRVCPLKHREEKV